MSEVNPYAAPQRDHRFAFGPHSQRRDRLKPRLKRLEIVTQFTALGTGLLSAAFAFVFLIALNGIALLDSVLGVAFVMLGIAVPGLVARLVPHALKVLCKQFGLMSAEEARHFPVRGPYPECWLEPAEEE